MGRKQVTVMGEVRVGRDPLSRSEGREGRRRGTGERERERSVMRAKVTDEGMDEGL